MIAKISDLAAKILVQNWYALEPGLQKEDATEWQNPKPGDEVDIDCGILIRKADGWYIQEWVPMGNKEWEALEAQWSALKLNMLR